MLELAENPLLRSALAGRFGFVRHLEQVGSTNKDLLARPFDKVAALPALLWADHQTAGRGRRDRSWHDQPGHSLTFSVAIERDTAGPGESRPTLTPAFTLVAGVVVVRALTECLPSLQGRLKLKWPNDILLNGGKVAGILTEMRREKRVERWVIGCGINLLAPQIPAPDRQPGSLPGAGLLDDRKQLSAQARQDLVSAIAVGLVDAAQHAGADGFDSFRGAWMALDAFAGQAVRLTDDGVEIVNGTGRGIDASGALLIEQNGQIGAHAVGDLSARLVCGESSGETGHRSGASGDVC